MAFPSRQVRDLDSQKNWEFLGQRLFFGGGNPNGVITASPGALYLNRGGGAATTLWVKESGVNTNTGWVGK